MLEKEQAELAKKAEAELVRHVLELEDAKDAALRELRLATEEKTQAAIKKIEAEYRQKGSYLEKTFADNRILWGDKIFYDVLYGRSGPGES